MSLLLFSETVVLYIHLLFVYIYHVPFVVENPRVTEFEVTSSNQLNPNRLQNSNKLQTLLPVAAEQEHTDSRRSGGIVVQGGLWVAYTLSDALTLCGSRYS